MKQFAVYETISTFDGCVSLEFQTHLNAKTPANAIEVAKRKGFIAPVIGASLPPKAEENGNQSSLSQRTKSVKGARAVQVDKIRGAKVR